MPRDRIGTVAMTPAERQARHRARLRQENHTASAPPARRVPPRPRRWAAAVATLVDLQDEYCAWLGQLLATHIEPRFARLNIHPVDCGDGRDELIIRAHRSLIAPHRVLLNDKFYGWKYPLDV